MTRFIVPYRHLIMNIGKFIKLFCFFEKSLSFHQERAETRVLNMMNLLDQCSVSAAHHGSKAALSALGYGERESMDLVHHKDLDWQR